MVQRYDPTPEGTMEKYHSGGYVTFDDYQDIQEEKADLEAKIKKIEKALADLWREI